MQNFMFLRTVDPDVLRRAEIADFGIKVMGVNVID